MSLDKCDICGKDWKDHNYKCVEDPQLDWSMNFKLSNLYDAFVAGAREMKMNPTATDHIIQRTADAYTKGIQMDKEK